MNWEEQFKKFFNQEIGQFGILNCDLFIFREDGIPVYGKSSKIDTNTVGALMAGSWQAAKALSGFVPGKENHKDEFFRFSFDTSDRGVYILPFSIRKNSFLFGSIFSGKINPGHLKSKMRFILEKLLMQTEVEPSLGPLKKETFLFKEITDGEIDQIFSFEGN